MYTIYINIQAKLKRVRIRALVEKVKARKMDISQYVWKKR